MYANVLVSGYVCRLRRGRNETRQMKNTNENAKLPHMRKNEKTVTEAADSTPLKTHSKRPVLVDKLVEVCGIRS
jgi:hypothetical protein